MVDLCVFDLGGVILPFDHRKIASRLAKRSPIPEERIFSMLFDGETGLINAYEEGHISSFEFFLLLRQTLRIEASFEEFTDAWNQIFEEDGKVVEILHRLKDRGKALFLLSNTNELHFSHLIASYPVLHLFDEWILSFEVGARKPKREIFEKIFQKSHLLPHRTLYVDDLSENVLAASSLGIKAHLFSGAENLELFLEEQGVLP
jgi:putative hydrolase of the HAD superfamily